MLPDASIIVYASTVVLARILAYPVFFFADQLSQRIRTDMFGVRATCGHHAMLIEYSGSSIFQDQSAIPST